MSRCDFLLTLFAGDATREFTYGSPGYGQDELHLTDQSDWDFPVMEPISRAEFEMKNDAGSSKVLTINGSVYLKLSDAPGVIEGMLEAISRGKSASEALEQAKLAASIAG